MPILDAATSINRARKRTQFVRGLFDSFTKVSNPIANYRLHITRCYDFFLRTTCEFNAPSLVAQTSEQHSAGVDSEC